MLAGAGVISEIHQMNRRIASNLEDRDEQSERKLMYVAMTRAEDCLAVTYSEQSAYVDEIAKNIESAAAGL